jgi:hypothetical protein
LGGARTCVCVSAQAKNKMFSVSNFSNRAIRVHFNCEWRDSNPRSFSLVDCPLRPRHRNLK